jgi:5-formyltetrahydrofolate cyclo-ligase
MPPGKAELRRTMDEARRALSADEHRRRSEAICRRLVEYTGLTERGAAARTIMAFMPFRGEADVVPFLQRLWETGHRILLPRTEPARGAMALHYVTSPDELVRGRWGIPEPPAHLPVWDGTDPIDLVLVPGLAFDRKGGRLGYGGGYYDRFFAGLAAGRTGDRAAGTGPAADRLLPQRLAPAFAFQVVPEVPMEAGDWRVNGIVTEDGWIPCAAEASPTSADSQ